MNGIFNKSTHFVSFFANNMVLFIYFFSQSACIHFLASGKQPLMFEGQSRWREDMGDKAECDLITGHLLASDLKKNQFLAEFFSFGTIAAFSSMWSSEEGQFS